MLKLIDFLKIDETSPSGLVWAVRPGRSYDKSGTSNPRAKVTPEDVQFIRDNYIKGHKEFGGAALGRRFGLAKTTVFHIINATSWGTV